MTQLEMMGEKAKKASVFLATAGKMKSDALFAIANALEENIEEIKKANAIDIENGKEAGLSTALIDRLLLTDARIHGMADAVRQVADMADPIGEVLSGHVAENGLKIEKIRVPLGVAGIIFEARPNVTSDAASLCLKAGNAVILRGGKEAINSNIAIADIMRNAIEKAGLPKDSIQLVEDTSRNSSLELMQMTEYLDVLIPRGGAGLIKAVTQNSKVPVIETGVGNCHVYVDKYADMEMACEIIFNAKTSRPSVCNAIETVLVHKDIAQDFLPLMKKKLDLQNVELRGCEKTREILKDITSADDSDWETEYLDYILACKVADSFDEAIEHIRKYSSGHSECIVTENYSLAENFINGIDAAAVYVNASTRFTDGGQFGLGAEIGISTQKLHARGPMGLNELTSMKFIIRGNGQVR